MLFTAILAAKLHHIQYEAVGPCKLERRKPKWQHYPTREIMLKWFLLNFQHPAGPTLPYQRFFAYVPEASLLAIVTLVRALESLSKQISPEFWWKFWGRGKHHQQISWRIIAGTFFFPHMEDTLLKMGPMGHWQSHLFCKNIPGLVNVYQKTMEHHYAINGDSSTINRLGHGFNSKL